MNNSPYLTYDAFFYLLALIALLFTGSLIMLGFGVVFACLLGNDIRRLVPAEHTSEEVHADDDPDKEV